ncbi:MAG: glycosyltransferase family 2 protein [Peptococcaceae bacterium]|jgi:dolichol-phosphate mannosyltransferase|nr:glycosyltransferase family 2 protein [Peptococcaceae bacterium]
MLSVVIPAYNENENITVIVREVASVLSQAAIDHEIIFVDDGSTDGTFAVIEREATANSNVRGLKLSRNFGKEAAILAGLDAAKGDCCVVIDADLQHPPTAIPEMYKLWQGGAMIVHGVKKERGRENRVNKAGAGLFYRIISRFTDIDFHQASDFKLLDRRIIDILAALPEKTRFFRGLSAFYGFSQADVEFSVGPRKAGATNWSLPRLFVYALDSISSFTAFPLQIVTCLGAAMLLIFIVLGIQTLYNYCMGRAVEGFTTVILLLLFIASSLSISLGIIGHYIAKIYEEVKARPVYILEKATYVAESGYGADDTQAGR